MRILDVNGKEIISPDPFMGRLEEDRILIAHHPAIAATEEQFHYEVIAEYPNGGRDIERIIDVPNVAAEDAWDEYEDIWRYIPYTPDELAEMKLSEKTVWDELAEALRNGVNSV